MCPETGFLTRYFLVTEITFQISAQVNKPELFKGVQCFKCLPECLSPKGLLISRIHTSVEVIHTITGLKVRIFASISNNPSQLVMGLKKTPVKNIFVIFSKNSCQKHRL